MGVGILDGFGLAMFLPLLQLTDNSSLVDSEELGKLGFIVDNLEDLGINFNLFTVLAIMSIFFILKGGLQYLNSLYNVNLRQFFIRNLRYDLSNAMSKMSYKSFVQSDAGRIQNTLSGEVTRISKAYLSYFGAFEQIILVITYMVFAFFIDARFAMLICIGGGLTNFVYKKLYLATKVSSIKLTKNSNHYQGLILQLVTNFKYLKATNYVREYNDKLKEGIRDIEENNRYIGKLNAIVHSLREPILILVVSFVILVQVMFFGGSLGTILISLLFFYRALASLILLQTHYNDFLAVSGSMDNMTNFEKELEESREIDGHKKIDYFRNSIELRKVSFEYSGQIILKEINYKVLKNRTVAFVGESGSGKTTLINILAGLLPVSSGEMLIDGVDSRKINIESYRRRVGYITQEPVIFNDSIYNNVSFWAEPTIENIERFNWAVQQASLTDFIKGLPNGLQTILGNYGVNISGGEKQRISIARELFRDVDILVLDEATSALDSGTEEVIQKGIEELHGKYTILIVAHRLSTIKNADCIVVLSDGKIIDEGDFEQLILNSSKFQKMVELQEV